MRKLQLRDGTTIVSLNDLSRALCAMEMSTFSAHVDKDKNDFADWVEQEFGLFELAARMRHKAGPLTMAVEVLKHQAFTR